LSSGGPYYGFMTTRGEFSRQLPGRIVGKTLDSNGNEGFVLTLQAREQHIRRSKATSNICTNQGLMVTASTMYMSLYGEQGLVDVAKSCHSKLNEFMTAIKNLKGIEVLFDSERFHEVAICMPKSSKKIIEYMESHGISPGLDLSLYFPELENTVLACVTEVKTTEDIQAYVSLLEEALEVIE
jgi:glycine dehydrogenase subunit 1